MAIRKFNSIGGFSVGEIGNTHDVINNVGNVTANNLTVTNTTDLGNIGNIKITGGTSGYVLKTDGSGNLTWVDPLSSGLSGSNTQIQFNDNGSLGSSANLTFDKTTNTLSTRNVVATLLTGTLTTAAQPNITSVGTLTGLTVEGDTSITGNLKVQGSFDYINSTTTYITDPITEQGGGANGATLTSDDNRDRGSLLHYHSGTDSVDAFMGWDNSNSEFSFGSNVSVTDNIVTFNHLGNVRANVVIANLEGTLRTSAQPNITSVGTLTGLTVAGDVTITDANLHLSAGKSIFVDNLRFSNGASFDLQSPSGNTTEVVFNDNQNFGASSAFTFDSGSNTLSVSNTIVANYITGTLTTHAQPNITSVGELTTVSVSGNAHVSGNLSVDGNITFTGNGTINQISGNSGQFFGDAHGIGALYAGLAAGYSTVFNPVIQASADDNAYVQINFQNINQGVQASTDYCATSDNGTDTKFFIDFGITGGSWDGSQENSLGNALLPDDGYLYVQGDNGAGNLVIGTATSGTEIKFIVGGPNTGNIKAKISSNGLVVTGNVVATYLKGEAGNISNVQGANVSGEVSSANIAWRVSSSAQPNITSVGTLTDLSVSGNTTIAGNLIVNGTAAYANISSFNVKDPIIEQGGNVDGALTSNDGKDRGQLLHYYTSEAVDAFMGWDNSNAEFTFGANVTVADEVVTFNELATVRAKEFIANNVTVADTVSVSTVAAIGGSFSDTLTAANTVVGNATLTNATVTNFVASDANVSGTLTIGGNLVVNGSTTFVNSTTINYVDPIIQLNGNPDNSPLLFNDGQDIGIRAEYFDTSAQSGFFGRKNSTGYFEYLTNISETSGVVSGDYGTYKGLTYISTATTGTAPFVVSSTTRVANLNVASAGIAETVSSSAQPNITSVGTLTSANVTGNLTSGNANLGNLVTANYFSGNGSYITYIAGGNVSGQVANSLVSGTVYSSAQPNITSVGTLTSLVVNGETNLGPLRDVIISGGAAGYYLTTNGAGDLTWAPGTTTGDAKFVSMIKRDFVADGTTFVYTLPTTPVTQEAVSVNIDGLMQTQSVYTVLGAEVHFDTAPIAGQIVEFTVYGVVDITGNDGEVYFSKNGQIGTNANLSYNNTTGEFTATGFTGNGYHLHHINSANIVGGINSALSAIYSDTAGSAEQVTDPNQPNITSVGVLTGLAIAGHIIPTADITYDLGNSTRRFRDLHLSGQTIQLGDSTLQTVGDTLVLTNPIGGQFVVDGSNAAYASLASYVTEANQANITQLGTLLSLDVSGDITANANVTANGNITINGGYLTIDSSMIAVQSGNAGIFNLGASNVSVGLSANVTMSTAGKTTDIKGMLHVTGDMTADGDIATNTLNSGYIAASDIDVSGIINASKIKVGDLYSSRLPIEITTDTVIDQFDPITYRSAKYTIRVNSGDGYQAAEVLLIHDGADAYVTIYGSLSTIGLDIASFRAEITAGLVTLYATTNSGTTTTVNLLGTYVAD